MGGACCAAVCAGLLSLEPAEIEARLDAVEELSLDHSPHEFLGKHLASILDLSCCCRRSSWRAPAGAMSAALARRWRVVPLLKQRLAQPFLRGCETSISLWMNRRGSAKAKIRTALADEFARRTWPRRRSATVSTLG